MSAYGDLWVPPRNSVGLNALNKDWNPRTTVHAHWDLDLLKGICGLAHK